MGDAVLLSFPTLDRALRAPGSLAEALCRLNIAIHPAAQVEEYKQKFVRSLKAKELLACGMRLSLPLIVAFVFAVLALWGWTGVSDAVASVIISATFALLCLKSMLTALDISISTYIRLEETRWRKYTTFAHHLREDGAPSKVRRKARKLQRNLPGVTFSIEWCDKDPFLWAKYGNQSYCIAHWDEPGFVEQ
jgi:hypothetical protein